MISKQDTFSDTSTSASQHGELPPSLSHLFAHLPAETVEQFYHGYQRWLLQQQLELLHVQLPMVRQRISENEELMRQQQPTAVALAVLVRLQSNGVNDIDLLDRMLERGEEWLDTTLQLLVQCERLGMIHGDYTQWCEHALDDAYNWLASMQADDFADTPHAATTPASAQDEDTSHQEVITEEMILQKLMSDGDEETAERLAVRAHVPPTPPSFLSQAAAEPTETTPAVTSLSDSASPAQAATTTPESELAALADKVLSEPTETLEVTEIPETSDDTTESPAVETEVALALALAPAAEVPPAAREPSAVEDAEAPIELEIAPEELELPPIMPQAAQTGQAEHAVGAPGQRPSAPPDPPAAPAASSPTRRSGTKKRGFFSHLFSTTFS